MKVLVAGGGGQLGRSLPAALKGHAVTALSHAELDITNAEAVEKAFRESVPELVINAAAYNQVDKAESEPAAAFAVNAQGPKNLAVAAAKRSIPIVHVSTDYVFDGTKGRPYDENDKPNPLSVYAQSKWQGEEEVRSANPRHFVVRTAWVYHPVGNNFPNAMLSLSKTQEVKVVKDQVSSPTYAPYLATSIAALAQSRDYGTYHLAGSGGASRFEWIQAVFEALGVKAALHPVLLEQFPAAAARPKYTVLASVKTPPVALPPWRQGVREFAKGVKSHL